MEIFVSPSKRTWRVEIADIPEDMDFVDTVVEALEQMLGVYDLDTEMLYEGLFWIDTDAKTLEGDVYDCVAGALAIAAHMQAAGELHLVNENMAEWRRVIDGHIAEWRRDNMLYEQQVRRMNAGKESES